MDNDLDNKKPLLSKIVYGVVVTALGSIVSTVIVGAGAFLFMAFHSQQAEISNLKAKVFALEAVFSEKIEGLANSIDIKPIKPEPDLKNRGGPRLQIEPKHRLGLNKNKSKKTSENGKKE
jgi:hypothetical protein